MFFVIIFVLVFSPSSTDDKVHLDVHQRIKLLKQQISEQINARQKSTHQLPFITIPALKPILKGHQVYLENEEYDYVEVSDVTPINEHDPRKKDRKFRLPQLKTKQTTRDHSLHTPSLIRDTPFEPHRHIKRDRERAEIGRKQKDTADENDPLHLTKNTEIKMVNVNKPLDVFFRRLSQQEIKDFAFEWTHCEDMITPYLTVVNKALIPPKRLPSSDRLVSRVIQLLTLNTTSYPKEDIYAVMYQLSSIKIRLFQWDVSAMRLLFNTICKEKRHTLISIKAGIQRLFKIWHMDISNTTNLLRQARIYRPYCVRVTDYEGSTKSSGGTRYTKPTVKTTSADNCDDDG